MRTPLLAAAVALTSASALLLSGCGRTGSAGPPVTVVSAPPSQTPGTISLDPPFAKPHVDMTDDHGHPYDLAARTAGRPLLLYFGYTHCPDVCPTTMADIAATLRHLPAVQRDRIVVVFVTTDPDRDTAARLRQWLGGIDPDFVGLRGSFTTVQAAAKSVGIAVSRPVRNPDGSETVSHGAEVLAFSPKDNRAHMLYTAGAPQSLYAATLPRFAEGLVP